MLKKRLNLFIITLATIALISCNKEEETAVATMSLPGKTLSSNRLIVQSVFFDQDTSTFNINGKNFQRIEKVQIKNSENNKADLTISSQTSSSIEATYSLPTEFNLLSNSIIELILSTATGAAIVPLSFTVADGAITEVKIEDGAITTDKIADESITTAKIEDGAITFDKLHHENASDGQVVTWSRDLDSWVPVDFETLQSSDGAVESIARGIGFEDKGEEITQSGTLNLDVGNSSGQIAQFDETDGSLTIINDLIIDSNGGNDGRIQFNIDGDAAFEYTIEASGSGLSFKSASAGEAFYIHSDGSLVTPNVSIGGSYEFPDSDGAADQILKTDGSGELTWVSFGDIATDSLSLTAESPLSFDDATNTISINDIESDQIKNDTIVNEDISATANIALSKLTPFALGDLNMVLISNNAGEIVASTISSTHLGYLTGLTGNIKDTFLSLTDGGTVDGNTSFTSTVDLTTTNIDGNSTLSIESGSRINIKAGATLEVNGTLTLVDAVDSASIKNDSVTTNDIKDETIITDDIEDETITDDDISLSADIAASKIKALVDKRVIISDIDGTLTTSNVSSTNLENLMHLEVNTKLTKVDPDDVAKVDPTGNPFHYNINSCRDYNGDDFPNLISASCLCPKGEELFGSSFYCEKYDPDKCDPERWMCWCISGDKPLAIYLSCGKIR